MYPADMTVSRKLLRTKCLYFTRTCIFVLAKLHVTNVQVIEESDCYENIISLPSKNSSFHSFKSCCILSILFICILYTWCMLVCIPMEFIFPTMFVTLTVKNVLVYSLHLFFFCMMVMFIVRCGYFQNKKEPL